MSGAVQERARAVSEESERLQAVIQVLGERIEELRLSLVKVCRERGPDAAPPEAKPDPPSSELGYDLRNRRREVEGLIEAVTEISARLDL